MSFFHLFSRLSISRKRLLTLGTYGVLFKVSCSGLNNILEGNDTFFRSSQDISFKPCEKQERHLSIASIQSGSSVLD